MNLRIYFSALPCAFLCGVVLYYSEQTKWAPFAALVLIMLFVFGWCLHMRLRWSHQLNTCSKIILDVSGFLAFACGLLLAVLFGIDRLDVITKSNELSCPYAANVEMPVHVLALGQWYCAPWRQREPTVLSRAPVESGEPVQLLCSDTFVGMFGVSIEPHSFQCPSGCLRQYSGSGLTGCGIYSLDTPVCIAAIHAGILTDAGGRGVVYGRLGLPKFERCSRNSLTSEERQAANAGAVSLFAPSSGGSSPFTLPTGGGRRLAAAPPLVLDSTGAQVPQAFHFNNLPHTSEYLWLKDWERSRPDDDGVDPDRPWTRIEAAVSARVAGVELQEEKVRLGKPETQLSLFSEATPGHAQSTQCQLSELGVVCPGRGWAALHLDFCQPDVGSCLG